MKRTPRWLSKNAVLAIHERLLAEHGGPEGLLDERRLESALASPRNHFAYGRTSLFVLAEAYASALTRDHPFKDGNKRVALTVAGIFLELNGLRLEAEEAEAATATLALASRKLSQAAFAAWLEKSSVRIVRTRPTKRRRT